MLWMAILFKISVFLMNDKLLYIFTLKWQWKFKALSVAQSLFWLATWTTMIGPGLPVRDCPLSYKKAMFAIYRHEKLPGIQLMNIYLTCDSPLCINTSGTFNKKNSPEDFVWGDWETSISPNKPVSLYKNPPPPRANPYLITTQSNRLKFI